MKLKLIAAAAIAVSIFISCAGAPKIIPDDLSARELVQRAQESSDAYNYEAAVAYYKALGERFSTDLLYKTTSDYEIAFIAYKQGHYAEAKEGFELLQSRFDGPDGASMPQQYAILTKKILQSIADKTKKKLE
jgi:outer membrane protein assembly factor BamD (BamD/ComL family)